MMDEAPADLRELVRLPDVLVVCSSTGWTNEKHMLYLQLLEETFVSQLHDGEHSFKGLFNLSPRYCRQVKSSKQIVEYAKPDQGCHGIVDADRVKSCMKVELMDSPSCCGNQQDGKIHSTDDNASTTEPVEEAISQARTTSSGQSSTCYVGKYRHSPSRSAEGSDQNFDEETKGTGESRRGCSQKRLKSYNVMRDDEVQKAGLIACDKHEDKYNGSLKVDAGSLDAEAGSPT
ncbi:hypothetical protein SEVIR_2G402300v4 [Setaria viridis]|uniref:Uncharacterized protein n=1 Tax=Setaria viridis TaxID=4556 RepID=A0A4U6W593_SETVI|nr:uncharacterized protein LOC117846351 [Setaria viridis]TKW35849.1 hypothetical protein SEVIR_2G402300v2 [Setaria viridis]